MKSMNEDFRVFFMCQNKQLDLKEMCEKRNTLTLKIKREHPSYNVY